MATSGGDERTGAASPPTATDAVPSVDDASAPRCLYCHYNLTGLPEPARCPECGMVNVPQAYRLEVQKIVDDPPTRRRLFRTWIRRYPPGWWWSLDRPGDLVRSFRAACKGLGVALLLICVLFVAFGSVVVVEQTKSFYYAAGDWTRTPLHRPQVHSMHLTIALLPIQVEIEHEVNWMLLQQELTTSAPATGFSYATVVDYRPSVRFSWGPVKTACVIWLWFFLSGLVPAQVGLWTQIRRGLPDFAKPRRTIVAAANWQVHAMLKLVAVLIPFLLLEMGLRLWGTDLYRDIPGVVLFVGAVLLASPAITWVGALRSDFTRQLVRSRLHALRIVMMYVWLVPFLTVLTIVAAWSY